MISNLSTIYFFKGPAQTLLRELASDKSEGKKIYQIQAEMLSKCFISELLILLNEKYTLLLMVGKIDEIMRNAIIVKLRMIINAMQLRLKRVGIAEMGIISNELHRILRLMEFVILINRAVKMSGRSDTDIDYVTIMKDYGINNVLLSVDQYSLRDDNRTKALLHRFSTEYGIEQIAVISNYKVCTSQMKYVYLSEVQWFVCDKGHVYIMRIFDDVVLQCECNQNDGGKLEILRHLTHSALHHPRKGSDRNKKQYSHSSSVVSEASSSNNSAPYGNNVYLNTVPNYGFGRDVSQFQREAISRERSGGIRLPRNNAGNKQSRGGGNRYRNRGRRN